MQNRNERSDRSNRVIIIVKKKRKLQNILVATNSVRVNPHSSTRTWHLVIERWEGKIPSRNAVCGSGTAMPCCNGPPPLRELYTSTAFPSISPHPSVPSTHRCYQPCQMNPREAWAHSPLTPFLFQRYTCPPGNLSRPCCTLIRAYGPTGQITLLVKANLCSQLKSSCLPSTRNWHYRVLLLIKVIQDHG